MKHVKMLALAAVAAASLMAFVGAGTASASVICSTTTTPCTSVVPNKTAFDFSSNEAILEVGGIIKNKCASTLTGTLDNGSSTVTAKLTATALTWTGCTITPAVTTVLGNLEIHNIAGTSNGTVTANGFKVTNVILGQDCIFETGEGLDLGTLTEGKAPATAPTLAINVTVTSKTANCPSSATWRGTYTLTSPTETTLSVSAS